MSPSISEQGNMRRTSFALAAFAALALVLAPGLADARAGGGGSMGSRGGRTWSAPPSTNTAPSSQPFQRSMSPNTPSSPGYAAPGYGPRGAAAPRSAFTSGLLGGLVGAGIGGLLLGHGFFGGMNGGLGFLGFLLQIFLIVMVVRWLVRRFRGARPSFAGAGSFFAPPGGGQRPMPMGGGIGGGMPTRPQSGPPIAISPADYQSFEQNLQAVQAAWSAQDLNGLRALATPEMVSYFAEQLADQSSRGVRNTVTDVRLEKGDLAEAWAENGREYATVAMRFSMIDATRDGSGRIVDGSASEHVTATELWTFLRSPGGRWILSGIQQAR
jgi:predicted lipid-binding transport protein (Tim44 family)